MTLPRPRLVNVIELVESVERSGARERRKTMPRFDESLAKAVSKDMADYMGEVMSSVSFRSNAPGRTAFARSRSSRASGGAM